VVAVALCAWAAGARSTPAGFAQPPAAADDDAAAFLAEVEKAWNARDALAYLALWDFASPEARAAETAFVAGHMTSDDTHLRLQKPPVTSPEKPFAVNAEAFTVVEPRARVEQWVFLVERRGARWAMVGREPAGGIDGLVHLSLDPGGFRADGLTLRLPDFELRMDRGTLFTSPASVGPTVLVFVGEGTVRVSPSPPAEQEQLRQFGGSGRW
jgi:hypothetical protein